MGTWTQAREKIRRDLWRDEGDGTAGVGIPETTLDEAIHQACVDLEGERRWCYLELIQETTDPVTVNRLAMPIISRGVNWLAATLNGRRRYLTLAPLDRVIELAELNGANAWPQFYAISGSEIFLDCAMTGGHLEASHTFQTPDLIDEAIERGDTNLTLQLQFQLVCARAAAVVSLTYMKDADEAQRQEAAYTRMYDALMDRDDAMRESMTKPEIEPDVGVAPYNWQ
jgi:hypothetical protein